MGTKIQSDQLEKIIPVIIKVTNTDLSTNSGSWVDIDSSLDITATVPASGAVLITGSLDLKMTAQEDCFLGVGIGAADPAGINGGHAFDGTQRVGVPFGDIITGLTPGSNTFKLHWQTTGSGTVTLEASGRGGAKEGSWWMVLPITGA